MDANELRALADALRPMAKAPCFDGIDIERAADYLRAQADAQPVAMLASHRRLIEQAIQSAEHPSGMSTHDGKARIDASVLRRMLAIIDSSPAVPQADALPVALVRAYNAGYMAGHHDTVEGGFVDIHPSDMDTYHADVVAELGLPAVPQAEPIDPHMIVADDRFPDAQAEPKRKPLSDEQIDAALQTDPVLITRLMIGSMTVGEFKAALRRLARTVERAHEIGGSDAE